MKAIVTIMVAVMMTIAMASESHPRSQSSSSTVPAFLWSGYSYLTKGSHKVSATLSSDDIKNALNVLTHSAESDETNQLIELISQETRPEAIVIFVEPELRTDLITKYSNDLPNLQKLMKKARTSVEVPYIKANTHDSVLTSSLVSVLPHVNMILARDEADRFQTLERNSNVVKIEISNLVQYLTTSDVFSNNKVDVIVVCFEESASEYYLSSSLQSHDEIIAKVAAEATKDTVFMYIADSALASRHVWTHAQARYSYQYVDSVYADNSTNTSNRTNHTSHTINYFPGPFLEILIVSAFLLAMLFSGGCALFGLQTPDRWDPPKALKVKEN